MKKYTLILFVCLIGLEAYSQVGGISASKLGTLCTTTVPEGTIEFEPYFGYSISSNIFDSNGKVQELYSSPDSTMNFASSGFRFSYGLMNNLEIGVTVPVSVSEVSFGAKYKLPLEGKCAVGILAGYNTILGNQVYDRRNAIYEQTPAFVGGLIITYDFTNKLSLDFDAQYQKHTQSTIGGHTDGIFLNSDIGYYFIEKANFIIGLNYHYKIFDNNKDNSYLLTLNTGITIEKAKNFILVINLPFDLMGKNEYRTKGFGLALTIMLD